MDDALGKAALPLQTVYDRMAAVKSKMRTEAIMETLMKLEQPL
jgi:hypothetical protein